MEPEKNNIAFSSLREPKDLGDFEKKTKILFNKKETLKQAFTHRSYVNENKGSVVGNNERLEFLGDAVVELVVTNYLYKKYPELQEGELTRYRSALVNADTFYKVAQNLGMNDYLLLSKGQKRDTTRSFKNILADTFEAFIGAVYLDQGYSVAETFIQNNLLCKIQSIVETQNDWKGILQEKAQRVFRFTPLYEVVSETGTDNDKTFTVEVFCGDEKTARGTGKSKVEAEKQAAQKALESHGWL